MEITNKPLDLLKFERFSWICWAWFEHYYLLLCRVCKGEIASLLRMLISFISFWCLTSDEPTLSLTHSEYIQLIKLMWTIRFHQCYWFYFNILFFIVSVNNFNQIDTQHKHTEIAFLILNSFQHQFNIVFYFEHVKCRSDRVLLLLIHL